MELALLETLAFMTLHSLRTNLLQSPDCWAFASPFLLFGISMTLTSTGTNCFGNQIALGILFHNPMFPEQDLFDHALDMV
eukprot:6147607-Amphidinium_carterae.1